MREGRVAPGASACRLPAGERGGLAGHHAGAIRLRPPRGPGAVPPPDHAARPAGQVPQPRGACHRGPSRARACSVPRASAQPPPRGGAARGQHARPLHSAPLGGLSSEWNWRVRGRRPGLGRSCPASPTAERRLRCGPPLAPGRAAGLQASAGIFRGGPRGTTLGFAGHTTVSIVPATNLRRVVKGVARVSSHFSHGNGRAGFALEAGAGQSWPPTGMSGTEGPVGGAGLWESPAREPCWAWPCSQLHGPASVPGTGRRLHRCRVEGQACHSGRPRPLCSARRGRGAKAPKGPLGRVLVTGAGHAVSGPLTHQLTFPFGPGRREPS